MGRALLRPRAPTPHSGRDARRSSRRDQALLASQCPLSSNTKIDPLSLNCRSHCRDGQPLALVLGPHAFGKYPKTQQFQRRFSKFLVCSLSYRSRTYRSGENRRPRCSVLAPFLVVLAPFLVSSRRGDPHASKTSVLRRRRGRQPKDPPHGARPDRGARWLRRLLNLAGSAPSPLCARFTITCRWPPLARGHPRIQRSAVLELVPRFGSSKCGSRIDIDLRQEVQPTIRPAMKWSMAACEASMLRWMPRLICRSVSRAKNR
jgi:hypothetical protein